MYTRSGEDYIGTVVIGNGGKKIIIRTIHRNLQLNSRIKKKIFTQIGFNSNGIVTGENEQQQQHKVAREKKR